eukprot:sb/3474783/
MCFISILIGIECGIADCTSRKFEVVQWERSGSAMHVCTYPGYATVTLVLPLFPSSLALGLSFLDPKLRGPVSTVLETAVFGNRPYVVSIKATTTTAYILAVIRADDISSGGDSDKENKTKQHDVSLVSYKSIG